MLEIKNEKGTKYIISWKSNGLYNSKRVKLHGVFLPNGIQFNNTLLVMEQNSYRRRMVKVLIVCGLDYWIPWESLHSKTVCLVRLI